MSTPIIETTLEVKIGLAKVRVWRAAKSYEDYGDNRDVQAAVRENLKKGPEHMIKAVGELPGVNAVSFSNNKGDGIKVTF